MQSNSGILLRGGLHRLGPWITGSFSDDTTRHGGHPDGVKPSYRKPTPWYKAAGGRCVSVTARVTASALGALTSISSLRRRDLGRAGTSQYRAAGLGEDLRFVLEILRRWARVGADPTARERPGCSNPVTARTVAFQSMPTPCPVMDMGDPVRFRTTIPVPCQ